MKTIPAILVAAALAPLLCSAADATVEFRNTDPAKFRDFRASALDLERDRDYLLEELRRHLERTAPRFLPHDSKLQVTVTDVDMAGEYRPTAHPVQDIRVVKGVYPPQVDLEFRLTDRDGAVLKEGRRELRDLAFLTRIGIGSMEPLQFEKTMITRWLRSEFPAPR